MINIKIKSTFIPPRPFKLKLGIDNKYRLIKKFQKLHQTKSGKIYSIKNKKFNFFKQKWSTERCNNLNE